jgi:hypothetical protein
MCKDQLSYVHRVRLEALKLAVEYCKANTDLKITNLAEVFATFISEKDTLR